jgi:hypothetical protein
MNKIFETIEDTKKTHCLSDETLDKLHEIFYCYDTEPIYEYFDNYMTVAKNEKLLFIMHDISEDMSKYEIYVYQYDDLNDFLDILDTVDDMITREEYEEEDDEDYHNDTKELIDSLFN